MACLLVIVLIAPSALASDTTNARLWVEFVAWLQGRIGVPGGFTVADEAGFMAWLAGRIHIPNG